MFSSIGITEILIILTAALLLFGGKKIPQLARDLGTGIREFRRSLMRAGNEVDLDEIEDIGRIRPVRSTTSIKRKASSKPSKPSKKSPSKKKASRKGVS